MDVSPFEAFLTSLSRMTGLTFEIWNGKGFLFSSGAAKVRKPCIEASQAMSLQVMRSEMFRETSFDGRYAVYGVPIRSEEGVIASLLAHGLDGEKGCSSRGSALSPGDSANGMETFLTELAGLLEDKWASQKETEEMTEELSKSFEDICLYSKIAIQLKTLRFSGVMMKDLIADLIETVHVDLAFSDLPTRPEYNVIVQKPYLLDEDGDQSAFVQDLLLSIPQDSASLSEDYYIVDDSRKTPGYRSLHPDPYRLLAVKMQHNEDLFGWLGLVSFNMREIFHRSDLRLLKTMAEQIAVVIANTELYAGMESFAINVVKSLVHAIEAKDVYTRGHSERVNRYAMMIAERLQLERQEKEALHWASILHDIGKIGIPEAILNKPDRLDQMEYDIIKTHPRKGYDILQPIEQMRAAFPGILHHHERYDGKGYPDGLRGEEIPVIGRIIAVSDTFDAITSSRAYREARSREDALTVIEEVAGSQLDPRFVQVFKEAYNKERACISRPMRMNTDMAVGCQEKMGDVIPMENPPFERGEKESCL